MRKPTMQDIADALDTSRVTVWKAFNNKLGVSDELRQKIHDKAQEIGYIPKTQTMHSSSGPSRNIAVVVSRPESSRFWMEIIHELAIEFAKSNVNLIYSFVPQTYEAGYVLPQSLTDGSISGMIILNVYSERLITMLTGLNIPKVFLDTSPGRTALDLGGDILLIEGFTAVREITKRILDSGLRRISFIGDIIYAQTNEDRYTGFLAALDDYGLEPDENYILTKRLKFEEHYTEISRFLDGLPEEPEAIVCASDFILSFVVRYFRERKRPTRHITFAGFDNNVEYPEIAGRFTTTNVNTFAIGKRLASGILFRISNPDLPLETSYLHSPVIYRGNLS